MNNLLKTYKFSNFKVIKGRGCYLHTSDNKKLLDFSAGVAVNSLGIITITGVMKKKQTISAIVTDVNGVPSTITYQWIRINGTTETNIGQNSHLKRGLHG